MREPVAQRRPAPWRVKIRTSAAVQAVNWSGPTMVAARGQGRTLSIVRGRPRGGAAPGDIDAGRGW